MKDVATLAGVAVGTVSNVLNDPDLVRPQTQARVEAAMGQLGFIPNVRAAVSSQRTPSTWWTSPHGTPIASWCLRIASSSGPSRRQ